MSISKINVSGTEHELDATRLVNTRYIDGIEFNGEANVMRYGVCSTAADTAAKTVEIDNFVLQEGAVVIVKFTNANSVASPTLNVSGTGDKPIYRYGTTVASTGTTTNGWVAGAVQLFVYDGAGWIRDYWNNTTYSNVALGQGYATCSTAAATAAKVASLSSYKLTTGGIVTVRFSNAVTVANPTLNINSTGAKAIYWDNAALTDTTLIKAGDLVTFVYSSYYRIIAINGNGVVTAGSYGPTANVSGSNGATIVVPQISVDASGRVTGVTEYTYTSVNTDTTYSAATTSAAGLMSAADKAKLDGIATGANAYSLPTASSSTLGGVKTTSTVTSTTGLTACPIISGVPYYKDTDTTNYLPLSGGTVTGVTSFTDTTASTSTTTGAVKISGGLGVAGSIYGSVVYGAVWNDYAEFRETTEYIEAGRVVIENGDDTLSICTERLQSGANIVSDTYGFAIGETDVCKTPLAVSGRVLAYTYEDRYSFAPGDAVCAAPGGTVSKMTREEIMTYPERILGTVSAIPEYETWGAGNVAVNGRIWIKVK